MSKPIVPFDRWLPGTNQNSIPANDNSLRSEILSSSAISDSTTAQPSLTSPADDGKWYVIPNGATGSQWSAFTEDSCAIFYGGTWYEFTPVDGVVVTIDSSLYYYDSGWTPISGGGSIDAVDVNYDNSTSGLTATDVQDAIDELAAGGGGGSAILSVSLAAATNTTSAGWQKIPVDTVAYDTNSIWDAANKRAIPNAAGYYLVSVRTRTNTPDVLVAGIGKNGTNFIGVGPDGGSSFYATGGSSIIYCNGSTDYIENWAYAASVRAITTGTFDTYLQVNGPL